MASHLPYHTTNSNKVNAGVPNVSSGPSQNQSFKADRTKISHREPPSMQMNYSSNSGRNLTLKQLKDTIEEIYESKLKYDQKNFDGKLPR